MQSFMEYRVATFAWNTYRLDNYRLSSFDRYLTKISYNDEIVPQTIINQWLNDVGVPEASINGYIKTIRNFMKYRADMGKVVYLPPFQKTKDLYIPYIFSDEELSNIFAIADAYPMTNKFSSIPHIHMEMAVLIRLFVLLWTQIRRSSKFEDGASGSRKRSHPYYTIQKTRNND